MLHMYSYLMCASCFKFAFHKSYVLKSLQNFKMCYGMFAFIFFFINCHLQIGP
jgi:hypothetical protein